MKHIQGACSTNEEMCRITRTIICFLMVCLSGCQAQTNKALSQNNHPLHCDTAIGICGLPDSLHSAEAIGHDQKKSIKVVYFTDPICSACWGIEPQLRKLKLEYGHTFDIEYKMGGLLPDWSYNSGGISKPSDVAHHWDEMSKYYQMPIIGDVWLEDPLPSSYPPSIACKAAQMQDQHKAMVFLRIIREMVFLQKKNITKWEHLEAAAKTAGLNPDQLKSDYEGRAALLFEEDLKQAKQYGVRGFPTIFVISKSGNQEIIYGSKPYASFVAAIEKLHPSAAKKGYEKSPEALFSVYSSLTAREFAELSGMSMLESEQALTKLVAAGKLEKLSTRNGSIWYWKNAPATSK